MRSKQHAVCCGHHNCTVCGDIALMHVRQQQRQQQTRQHYHSSQLNGMQPSTGHESVQQPRLGKLV
jgi:hypothetical protein